MNDKAIVPYRPLTPSAWEMIETIAPTVWRAGLFGVGSEAAAAAIMLKGYELGLSLTASFELIHVINGKPALSPKGALALIQQSGQLADLKIEDLWDDKGPTRCRVTMERTNGFAYTAEFSMDDAKRAGLVKSGSGWDKYPANMMRWRAIGFCADVVFPDVVGGMKRADELGGEITPEGDIIAVDSDNWDVIEVICKQKPPTDITELVTQYGAEAVMNANNGKVPSSNAEVFVVAKTLEVENAS